MSEYEAYQILRDQHQPGPKNPDGGILAKLNAIRKHIDEKEQKRLAEEAANVPGWQKYAHKANLHLKANQAGAEVRGDGVAGGSTTGTSVGGDSPAADFGNGNGAAEGGPSDGQENAPYPEDFKLIAEAVINNVPLPGMKVVPDTILRPSVSDITHPLSGVETYSILTYQ